eukprot:TRINITY_DN32692_c0_g1_i1.p1 TRINITY_DN32692_c0_g1~~TRINITY_DN32692_c0_g1_i1.p1  ORF type:complete len:297 (+),score=80.60 TRINITY_DN32692_c0_g1_i1:105-995(+)
MGLAKEADTNAALLQAFLEEKGLASSAAAILDVTGAESVADLKLLDAAEVEEVVERAGLKLVAGQKLRRAVAQLRDEVFVRRRSSFEDRADSKGAYQLYGHSDGSDCEDGSQGSQSRDGEDDAGDIEALYSFDGLGVTTDGGSSASKTAAKRKEAACREEGAEAASKLTTRSSATELQATLPRGAKPTGTQRSGTPVPTGRRAPVKGADLLPGSRQQAAPRREPRRVGDSLAAFERSAAPCRARVKSSRLEDEVLGSSRKGGYRGDAKEALLQNFNAAFGDFDLRRPLGGGKAAAF